MDKKARMEELIKVLNEASEAYYALDNEIMSNYEYDKLYDELVALEEELGAAEGMYIRKLRPPRNTQIP